MVATNFTTHIVVNISTTWYKHPFAQPSISMAFFPMLETTFRKSVQTAILCRRLIRSVQIKYKASTILVIYDLLESFACFDLWR